jgi:DnaJ-class molecular chaperone
MSVIGCQKCKGTGNLKKKVCPQCHGSGDGVVVDVSKEKDKKIVYKTR